MDGHVHHLACRLRLVEGRHGASALARRLQGVAGVALCEAYGHALDKALGDDHTVYVVRRVGGRVLFRLADDTRGAELADAWGRHLAQCAVRAIALDRPGNIVRFADQAEYIATFVGDLLRGKAWSRWYFAPFSGLQNRAAAAVIGAVLEDHRDYLPAILGHLQRSGTIESVLAALDGEALRDFWVQGLGASRPPDSNSLRPLFSAALQLAGALGLWAEAPPPAESLFQAFLGDGPQPVDWRDPTDLAKGVRDGLRFLRDRRLLRASLDVAETTVRPEIDRAVNNLDWLDRDWLRRAITDMLSDQALRDFWVQGLDASRPPDSNSFRPLFSAVLKLADTLGLWAKVPPPAESLFQVFVAEGPQPVDWRDRTGLAKGVRDGLRFLHEEGLLRLPLDASATTLRAKIEQVVAALDWLDREWLRRAVTSMVCATPAEPASKPADAGPDLPTRLQSLTPRHRDLIADLDDVISTLRPNLDLRHPASPANAVRIYAALIAGHPRWADEPVAIYLIQRLLAAWEHAVRFVPRTREHPDDLPRGSTGDGGAAADKARDAPSRAHADPSVRLGLGEPTAFTPLSSLSTPERVLVEKIGTACRSGKASESAIETACAGVFLLLRPIVDLRLPALFEAAGYPPKLDHRPAAVIATLGLLWGGEAALRGDHFDPGLSLFAGEGVPADTQELQEIWASAGPLDHARFQRSALQVLAGQRILQGGALHLYRLDTEMGGHALVGGDETALLWPFGQPLTPEIDIADAVDAWVEVWSEARGVQPTLVVDSTLAWLSRRWPETVEVVAGPDDADPSGSDDMGSAHARGRSALFAALCSLATGIDLPFDAQITMALLSTVVLRVWARWLRQFSGSSVPYLIDNFIRRPGRVVTGKSAITVELERRPLDMVMEMAGYTAPLERVPWLGGKSVHFRIEG